MHSVKKSDNERLLTVVAWLLAALTVVGIVWVRVHNEASTFNRLPGGNATTWDAMWTNLRVVGEVKGHHD